MREIKLPNLPKLDSRLGKALLAVGIIIAIVVAVTIWWLATIFSPTDPSGSRQLVKISGGQGLSEVTESLHQDGIISHPLAFEAWMLATGSFRHIQAGTYSLSPADTYNEIRKLVTGGKVTKERVTLIEDWTIAQMGAQLEKQNITSARDFISAAKARNFTDLIQGLSPDTSLEGFLFPDTYYFTEGSDPKSVIRTMLNNFITRTGKLKADISASGLSLRDATTLASIVGREAKSTADQKLVAGILLKRLRNDIPLQSDVTSLYVFGDWQHKLTAEDLASQSPYNTRVNKGLPPTPIGNPGMISLMAVLHPTDSPYLYYLSDSSGNMHYAATLDEHNANVAKYLK